jgi:hypothetical protein
MLVPAVRPKLDRYQRPVRTCLIHECVVDFRVMLEHSGKCSARGAYINADVKSNVRNTAVDNPIHTYGTEPET